jgi:effector-binding domain-containing protein
MSFTIENITSQPIVGIRTQTTMAEIGNNIQRLMPELGAFVGDRMAGGPLVRWHSWEDNAGEMELAVPVREPMEGTDRVQPGELPAGRAAVALHVGPYDSVADTWNAFGAWMNEQGLERAGAPWEQYLNDPQCTPPQDLQTKIVWPIK